MREMKERKRTSDKERIFSFGERSKLKSKDFTKKKKKYSETERVSVSFPFQTPSSTFDNDDEKLFDVIRRLLIPDTFVRFAMKRNERRWREESARGATNPLSPSRIKKKESRKRKSRNRKFELKPVDGREGARHKSFYRLQTGRKIPRGRVPSWKPAPLLLPPKEKGAAKVEEEEEEKGGSPRRDESSFPGLFAEATPSLLPLIY